MIGTAVLSLGHISDSVGSSVVSLGYVQSDVEDFVNSNGGAGRVKMLTRHRDFFKRKDLEELITKRDVWEYITEQEKQEYKDLLLELDADISEAARNYIYSRLTLMRLELEERRRMFVINTLFLYLYV